jgi:hypothetical protein
MFDPRWKFVDLSEGGSAYFYDSKSIFLFDGIVKVWGKIIYSEKEKQNLIKEKGTKYKKLDHALILYKIDCSKRRYQILEGISYASDGSILDMVNLPEFLAK